MTKNCCELCCLEEVRKGSYSVHPKIWKLTVGSAMLLMVMGTFSGRVSLSTSDTPWESPQFAQLMSQDRTKWPQYFLWDGWLPGMSPRTCDAPWAVVASGLACSTLEMTLASYPLHSGSSWCPERDSEVIQDMADSIPDHSNFLSDGRYIHSCYHLWQPEMGTC